LGDRLDRQSARTQASDRSSSPRKGNDARERLSPVIVISDAGPLIALAKIGSLPVIFQLSSMVLIPPAVFEEVDPGEREGILLALQEQADWLLVDDLRARAVAEAIFASQGVKTRVRGTLGLLVEAFRQGVLTRSE